MTILKPTTVSSDKFTWYKETDKGFVGSTEISDLGRNFEFGRVYDDACDEGLTIVSAKTGLGTVWAIDGHDEREGDIMGWHLKCVTPGPMKGKKVLIIND